MDLTIVLRTLKNWTAVLLHGPRIRTRKSSCIGCRVCVFRLRPLTRRVRCLMIRTCRRRTTGSGWTVRWLEISRTPHRRFVPMAALCRLGLRRRPSVNTIMRCWWGSWVFLSNNTSNLSSEVQLVIDRGCRENSAVIKSLKASENEYTQT